MKSNAKIVQIQLELTRKVGQFRWRNYRNYTKNKRAKLGYNDKRKCEGKGSQDLSGYVGEILVIYIFDLGDSQLGLSS